MLSDSKHPSRLTTLQRGLVSCSLSPSLCAVRLVTPAAGLVTLGAAGMSGGHVTLAQDVARRVAGVEGCGGQRLRLGRGGMVRCVLGRERAGRGGRGRGGVDVWATHVEEIGELATLGHGQAMLAGASAGVVEHLVMYPLDTVKTRMQAMSVNTPKYRNVLHAASTIVRTEGPSYLYRGVTAICLAAIPSHAVYFAVYEAARRRLGSDNNDGYHFAANALAGAAATMAHDAVVTPLDVVKQRLQMYGSSYLGVTHCIRQILKIDGVQAFYASYPTTVIMNVPFMSVHFATYEGVKHFLSDEHGHHHTPQHIAAGAAAGAMGGFVSNPLDVVKTRIQVQGIDGLPHYSGLTHAVRTILKEEGSAAFMRGVGARVLYFMPSAAICWSTYEAAKRFLSHDHDHDHDHHDHDHDHDHHHH